MDINKEFFNSIKSVLFKLKEKIGDDFVVFGSAPLYLLGVVDFNKLINDIDIVIKDKANIPKEAKEVTFHSDKNQKLYKLLINDMEIDIGSCWKGQEEFFYKTFENPIIVEGIKFANLDIIEVWKKYMVEKYGREKDRVYLKKIKEFKINK